MKQLKNFMILMIVGLIFLPVSLIAQDTGTFDPNITNYFVDLAGVVALTTLLVGFVKKILTTTGIVSQIISWVIAIAICYAGWLLKFGMFALVTVWYGPLIIGIGAAFIANGIFTYDLVKTILRFFKLLPAENAKPK